MTIDEKKRIEKMENDFTEIKSMLARITKAIEGDSAIGQQGLVKHVEVMERRLYELEVLRIKNAMMIKVTMWVGGAISTALGAAITGIIVELIKQKIV